MAHFLTLYVLPVVLLGVLVSLGAGLITLNRSGEKARAQSNQLMRWRVGLHAAAIVVIVLIVVLQ